MHAALDVHYSADAARAACLGFSAWTDAVPSFSHAISLPGAGDYEPGQFYRRELDPLLAVLKEADRSFETIVIDAYCHLDHEGSPGLGAHLAEALPEFVSIIGVAKNRFRDTTHAHELLRGESQRPLFVTSIGIPLLDAAATIATMHGEHRHPTLLKAVDQLARGRS